MICCLSCTMPLPELTMMYSQPLNICQEKIEIWSKTQHFPFNSSAPGKFEWNFRHVIFKGILVIDGWGISCKIALIWMSLDFTDDQSTLVPVMAWCCQATRHYHDYLSQSWSRSLSPYVVTRPQWVKNDGCKVAVTAILFRPQYVQHKTTMCTWRHKFSDICSHYRT